MKNYTFVDYATQGYITTVGLLILFFHNASVPRWPLFVAGHVAGLAFVHALIQVASARPRNRVLDFLRHFYPVLMYTAFYRETGVLNTMFFPDYLDVHFVALEQRLFGFQPSLFFMHRLPYLFVSEVFYAAYFSYYIMIAGVGLALFLRYRAQFYHYVSVVSFVFYCCYLTFIMLPVTGPRLFFREVDGYQFPPEWFAMGLAHPYPEIVQHGPFFQIIALIYQLFEPPGAAFPSSHVAVAWCTVAFSFRYLPRIRYVHFVAAVLLCLGTMYCRFHYAVDVIAGTLVATVLVPLGNWLYAKTAGPPAAAPPRSVTAVPRS
jgi:membrane-associated phospholipid phosphatase